MRRFEQGVLKSRRLVGVKSEEQGEANKTGKTGGKLLFSANSITEPPEGKIITEVIVTADREFIKAEKKRFKTTLKDAKKERALKAKEHDRENSPGQNGEDF